MYRNYFPSFRNLYEPSLRYTGKRNVENMDRNTEITCHELQSAIRKLFYEMHASQSMWSNTETPLFKINSLEQSDENYKILYSKCIFLTCCRFAFPVKVHRNSMKCIL